MILRHASVSTSRRLRGFTLLEVLLTVLIIGVISSMVMVNVSAGDASTRLDRAAQMIIAACRYARVQSLGHSQANLTGTTAQPNNAYGIQINTAANTITVYRATYNTTNSKWNLPGSAVADSLLGSGSYVLDFNSLPTCQGVTISAVSLNGTSDTSANTSSPYYCQYRPFGDAINYGSTAITLSYGGQTRTINIPQVGDPTEN
ncbi:MAG: prepilin-type N-terminal cleavage/methylation domain-containing protein [Phycisphaerae bacterium]